MQTVEMHTTASFESSAEISATTQAYEKGKANLGTVDIVIVVVYIAATFAIGIWASFGGFRGTLKSYFLAGRDMFWLPVGASIFASNIGSGHFIGLAGAGATGGIAIGSFEWIAPYNILMLGWIFLPIYLACGVYTMPEYLYRRFGGVRLRLTLSIISLALYVLTKIAVDLYAGAMFIQQAFDINLYLAIVSLLIITAIYTVLGGLKAVIYTDTMQTVIMLAGGILLMIISFIEVGGYENLKTLYMEAIPQTTKDILAVGNSTTCGVPRDDSFHLFRDPITSDLPWPGMIFGIYFLGSWYWCTDQVIVQRALAAKSLNHAKAGCLVAGTLKILPMYMIVMAGMISRVLFPDEVACAVPSECLRICGNEQGCSNIAYPKLVLELLPSVVISILWIPVLLSSAGGQLYIYLQSIQSALGPPIFVLYLFAIAWPRVNEQGAFWGLLSGFTVGVIRLVLDFTYGAPGCDHDDSRPWIVSRVNYLHVSPIVFVISSVVTLTISYLTKPLPTEQLRGTTWFTQVYSKEKENRRLFIEKGEIPEEEEGKKADDEINGKDLNDDINDIEMEIVRKESSSIEIEQSLQQANDETIKVRTSTTHGRWSFILNVVAVSLLMAVTFLFGYYA